MQHHTGKWLYFSSTGEDDILVITNNYVNSPAHEWDAEHQAGLSASQGWYVLTSITARVKCAEVEQQISVLLVLLMLAVLLSNVQIENIHQYRRLVKLWGEKKQQINKQLLLTLSKHSAMSKNPEFNMPDLWCIENFPQSMWTFFIVVVNYLLT